MLSSEGNSLVTIVADTCGRHDTLGGACAAESNQVRYALEKRHMHSCRDNFLLALACCTRDMSKRDSWGTRGSGKSESIAVFMRGSM